MSEHGLCGHNSYWRGVYGTCMICRAGQAEARVAALETALHNLVEVVKWHAKHPDFDIDSPVMFAARAALARPTPTPDRRQYGKKCAHDGYVVAGCRDCEARATTPTPQRGQ